MTRLRTIDIDKIKEMVNNRLIMVDKHPFLDLYLCNYTKRTQYDILWDQYTEVCRGLIIDKDGNILNNPFHKFFNLGENEKTMIYNLPAEVPSITEKLDGRLGILYQEGDNPAITTRGKFGSPYAKWATNWLRLKGYSIDDFKPRYTYLFEIIYPYSKIVVDYRDRTELVLLAVRDNDSDDELNHIEEAEELGFSYAKEFSPNGISGTDKINDALKYLEGCKGTEYEGFVCKYSNGLRIKIKSSDYKRLSKILTGISTRDIWSSLREMGTVDQIIENIPDELYNWVKDIERELIASKTDILDRASIIADKAKKINGREGQARYIMSQEKADDIRGIVFLLLDDRMDKAEKYAWRLIEPPGNMIYDTTRENDDGNK